jgi:selenium-binding protein 1
MSNCTNLSDLQLHSNFLTGFVPSSLLTLSSLKIISLDNNKLHGPRPVFHKGVKATLESNNFCRSNVGPCDYQVMTLLEIFEAFEPLTWFSIKGNDACTGGQWTDIWTGQVLIRCERRKIVTFKILNYLSFGTISPVFAKLTSLVNLTLAGNHLNGSIPDSLTTLPQLQLLDVSNNNLSGVIPIFSPKVKLNVTGNAFLVPNVTGSAFLVPNMSKQGGYENASKANLRHVIWITGMLLYSLYISNCFVLLPLIMCKSCYLFILISIINNKKLYFVI